MGAREGACTGAAQMPRPSTWRLIRNAAALAAASLTLLFNDWKNAARFNIIFVHCDGTPRSPGGPVEKEDAKIHRACGRKC